MAASSSTAVPAGYSVLLDASGVAFILAFVLFVVERAPCCSAAPVFSTTKAAAKYQRRYMARGDMLGCTTWVGCPCAGARKRKIGSW